jgi:ADP-ribose pyrophosphatase
MSLISSDRRYHGRVINLDVETVGFPDGSTGQLEMVRHPGASAVLPLLDGGTGDEDRLLLLRQYRHAAGGFIWEIPAGRLEPGELPADCARRELAEEAGVEAAQLIELTTIYTTPGFTDERIHLFLALGLTEGVHAREPDEFLELHAVPWTQVMRLIRRGEIMDAKTLVALLYARAFDATGRRRAEG